MALVLLTAASALTSSPALRARRPALLLSAARMEEGAPMRVPLWDEPETSCTDGEEYQTENLVYYGLVRSCVRDDSSLSVPMLFGMIGLLIKFTMLNAFLYQFFIHNRPNPNTWFKMFKSAPLPETMGAVATLFLAPAFLLKKLSSTSEFKDTANFCITLGDRMANKGLSVGSTLLLFVHMVSVLVILPYFCFANAALVAFNPSYYGALGSVLFAGIVLDVDEYIYWLYEKCTGAKLPKVYSTVRLSPRARAASDNVASRTALMLGVAQFALIILMKFGRFTTGVGLLWAVPVVSVLLRVAYLPLPMTSVEGPKGDNLKQFALSSMVLQLALLFAFVSLVPGPGAASLLGRLLVK